MTTDPSNTPPGDYLWDRSGPADPAVQRLESLLAPYRHQPGPRLATAAPTRRRFPALRPLIAAAALLIAAGVVWRYSGSAPSWQVVAVAGAPTIGASPIKGAASLPVGQRLVTDSASTADLKVADIGRVTVHPGTTVRLLKTEDGREHRLALDEGKIEAFITAPPRLFFVQTPAALAVDYGCAYTLEADKAGNGDLRVTLGWVVLEARDGTSTVPMGAHCLMREGRPPGTPFFSTASDRLAAALEAFDFAAGGAAALEIILAEATARDTLTLWHLLPRADAAGRSRVYDRLAALNPPPAGVTPEGIAALDRGQLDLWWGQVRRSW